MTGSCFENDLEIFAQPIEDEARSGLKDGAH